MRWEVLRMLFNAKEYRFCVFCRHAVEADSETMLCPKKGIVKKERHCPAFRYDPLKRIPASQPSPPDFRQFRQEDFTLD